MVWQKALLPSYYILDKHMARSGAISEFDADKMLNYMHCKNEILKLMFTCIHNDDGIGNITSLR